jgi:hypothetical protein
MGYSISCHLQQCNVRNLIYILRRVFSIEFEKRRSKIARRILLAGPAKALHPSNYELVDSAALVSSVIWSNE